MQGIAIHQKRPKKSTRKHEPLDKLNGGVDKCCGGLGYNAWQAPLDSGCFLKFWSYFSPTLSLAAGQNVSKEISKSTLWLVVTFVFSSKSLEETDLFTDLLGGAFKFNVFCIFTPALSPNCRKIWKIRTNHSRHFWLTIHMFFFLKGVGKRKKTPPMRLGFISWFNNRESSESTHYLELLLVQR